MGTLRDPLFVGILIAMWATSVMTVGHLLLASAVTAYLLLDAMLAARKAGGAREPGRTVSVKESTGRARDRVFVYRRYLEALAAEEEAPSRPIGGLGRR